jgi:N-methylhydantoinase A
MRYVGQSWELLVRVPAGADSMATLERAFHDAHERRYGHATAGASEIVNFRLTAIGAVPKPPPRRWECEPPGAPASASESSPPPAGPSPRQVHFGGAPLPVPVYERTRLPAGRVVTGPTIVEEMGATTVIPPGWTATVGEWGELVLQRRSV